jgi:hypothetical protein
MKELTPHHTKGNAININSRLRPLLGGTNSCKITPSKIPAPNASFACVGNMNSKKFAKKRMIESLIVPESTSLLPSRM